MRIMKKFKNRLGGLGSACRTFFDRIHEKYSGPLAKPVAFANRFSLLLHAAASWIIYFIMEAVSRHSVPAAWEFMTGSTAAFAYNSFMIFMSFMLVYLFRRRIFMRLLIAFFWLVLGIINGTILSSRVTPFTGQDLHLITDALDIVGNYMSPVQLILKAGGDCSWHRGSGASVEIRAEISGTAALSAEPGGPGRCDRPFRRGDEALSGAEGALHLFWEHCLCL